MRFTDIVYRKADGIAWLTMNRPKVYNAVRGKTSDELAEALQDAAADEGTSEVRYFDLIRLMPQSVVAMVDGCAIGSGNILAYICDFTICSDRSRFGQTGPRVGSPATGYFVSYLQRMVVEKRAREIWMLCRQYSAQEALEMGLVNAVAPVAELEAEVLRWCEDIKGVSPRILQLQKLSFNEAYEYMRGPTPAQRDDPDYQKSDEAEERRLAFLQRRKSDPAKNLPYLELQS